MFYLISSWALKSEAPVSVEQCARHSLDTDVPSDRNCSGDVLISPTSASQARVLQQLRCVGFVV